MCTTIAIRKNGLYFGRNMDIENHFGEKIIYTPRHFFINYRHEMDEGGYAILGIGTVIDGVPLYADGVNEKGLCIAGLNYLYNAKYGKPREGAVNLAPYELIPYILRKCVSVSDVKALVKDINITDTPINPSVPVSYLHFHIADSVSSVVLEPDSDGIKLYDNPYDILVNNPPFPYHILRLPQYQSLKNHTLHATFYKKELYSLGLGAYGLPGDFSSPSRFIRGEYLLRNLSAAEGEEASSVFRVLEALSVPKGAVLTENKKPHYTLYSCCIDAEKGEYRVRRYGDLNSKGATMDDYDPLSKEMKLLLF